MIRAFAVVMILAQAALPTPPPAPPAQNAAPVSAPPAPFSIPPIPGIDRTFALAAIQGNNAELDMARLTLERSSAPESRGYAQKMMSEHLGMESEMTPELMRVLGGTPPPTRLSPADTLAVAHLRSLPDVDFDQVYLLQQVGDHLATLTVFRTEADNGTDPRLKSLARKWLPTIQAHLELAVSLNNRIGGASPLRSH